MRTVVLLFGIAIFISLASRTATACSCVTPGTPCESYGTAAAVFVGTVSGLRVSERSKANDVIERRKLEDADEIDWAPVAYKFSVEQAYLGVAGAEVEIFTGRGGGDCGVTFQTGQRYLVYAYRYKDKLSTSICTRTKPFSRATEDITFLGTLASAAPGVTISGKVTYEQDEPSRSEVNSNSFSPDVQITIESESEKKEVRPDARGEFRVTGLPAGKYKLTLRIPETLTTYSKEQERNLSDRGCAVVRWTISDNGRVNGRVVNADGEPVANILVSLVDPAANAMESWVKLERTDQNGNFSFSAVPPGTYHIAVNHYRFPDPNDPTIAYPPAFYPGVIDQRHAKAITVGAGEKLSDFEVRVPSKRTESILTGKVVWADGSPVANAQLSVKDETYSSNSLSHGMTADEQGRFKINGYSGQKLVIEARSNRAYVPVGSTFVAMERSEPLKISLENPTHAVRIVVTKLR